MSTGLGFGELIEYTDWERGKWEDWLRHRGDGALATDVFKLSAISCGIFFRPRCATLTGFRAGR